MARKQLPLQKWANQSEGFDTYCLVGYDADADPDDVNMTCIRSFMNSKMPISTKWFTVLSMVVNGNTQYVIQVAWPIDIGGNTAIYGRNKQQNKWSAWKAIGGVANFLKHIARRLMKPAAPIGVVCYG